MLSYPMKKKVIMEYPNGLSMVLALVMVMQTNASHCQKKQDYLTKYARSVITLTKSVIVVKVYVGCDCQHHTAGYNCEMCEPLYNNAEYMRGTTTNANVCQSM